MRRVNAEELGALLWRVSQVGVLLGHKYIGEVSRYDGHRKSDVTHEFFHDITRRNVQSEVLVEKWKDAILVHSDGKNR